MKISLSKTHLDGQQCLIPAFQSDKEILDKLPAGQVLRGDLKKDRNPKFHDKFMAILRMVVANSEKWHSVEHLLIALKYSLGLVEWITGMDGTVHPAPRSIAFDHMDDFEFDILVYSPALPVLAKELGITVMELESNYGEYL